MKQQQVKEIAYLGKIKIKKVYERKKEDTDNKDTTK